MPAPPSLLIPADLPDHTRQQLAWLDAGITKAAVEGAISSESYRQSATRYREFGMELNARDAERIAELIELDPRLYVAGCMHNATSDGTTQFFLHTYIELLTEQAEARWNARIAA